MKETIELTQKEKKELIEQIGEGLQHDLDRHFKQWEGGLPFKAFLSQKWHQAAKVGLNVSNLANTLEKMGYIKILSTPKGKRFIFSGSCKWTLNEIQEWIQLQESIHEAEKEYKKLNKL